MHNSLLKIMAEEVFYYTSRYFPSSCAALARALGKDDTIFVKRRFTEAEKTELFPLFYEENRQAIYDALKRLGIIKPSPKKNLTITEKFEKIILERVFSFFQKKWRRKSP